MSAARTSEPEEMPLFDLLITLDGAHVQVDRRVLVPGQATLGDLHVVIQLAMGWQDCHLHAFTDRSGTTYGDTTLSDLDFAEESKVRVSEVLAERGDEIEYEYDFGDSWHHRIELVKIRPDEGQGIRGLACIGGGVVVDVPERLMVRVGSTVSRPRCPGWWTPIWRCHDRREREVRDLELSRRPVTPVRRRRCMVCDACGRRFCEVHRALEALELTRDTTDETARQSRSGLVGDTKAKSTTTSNLLC
ncbi:plasmid pRiA4b ORF-3 family protein [Candidatus Poriferisodalis sp.]|uniref:plasmid pRiA4b ORF-3 family protein n=1 Tax=Candidatus Poriferisodalis sp. TaxID=3101277 RepID=UPI003AF6F58F